MRRSAAPNGLVSLEYDLLLEGVYRHYGYDFRRYARPALAERLRAFAAREHAPTLTLLLNKVLRRPDCFARLLDALSSGERRLFDDAPFYRALRETAVPLLRSYPSARVWCVGCNSGDALSLAVLAHESGLARTRIYVTDGNEAAVKQAAQGTISAAETRRAVTAYRASGGEGEIAAYFTVRDGKARLKPALRERMVYATHNVTSDAGFNEFQVIVCRGVLGAFDTALQRHVHGLLSDSLSRFGILGLGAGDTLINSEQARRFEPLCDDVPLFRKVNS